MDVKKTIRKSLRGNQKAMRELFDFLSPNINFTCRRYLSDQDDVQEALQESMIKVFSKLESFDPKKGDLNAWVYKISVNESLQLIRKNNRHKHEILEDSATQNVHFEFNDKLEADEILQLISKLEGNYLVVFSLFYVEGYSHKEISELINIKESSSRIYYLRAKKKLQDLYNNL